MEIVEQATIGDIAQLADLLALLFGQERDFQPDRVKQEHGLQMLIESPDVGHIFVLRDGDVIIGMVSLLFTISTAQGGPVCWLEDMVVHPDHRSRGLGSMLLRHAIDFARSHNFSRITLLTDGSNTNAIQFYSRHGFVQSDMTPLRLYLPEHN